MITAAAGHDVAGMSEIHGIAKLGNNAPAFDGSVTLKQVALKPGPSWQSGISDLNGTIRFADGREVVEPATFTFGSAHANLEGRIESLSPLAASYALKADSVSSRRYSRAARRATSSTGSSSRAPRTAS